MTREEAIESLRGILTEAVEFENSVCYVTEEDREPLEMAIKALEQEPCDVFDEYGNYKYPSDVELTEPNTATSMPCEDAISRQAVIDAIDKWVKTEHILETLPTDKVTPLFKNVHKLPPVNPQPKTDVLDKIRAEIKQLPYQRIFGKVSNYSLIDAVIEIIDKYKAESEDKE